MQSRATLANWRTAPYNRWAFHHVREIVASVEIANDPARVRALPAQPADLTGLRIDPDSGEAMGLEAFLQETDTDAMAVLHRGRIVFERYGNGMTAQDPHILMSISKSMLGVLFEELGLDPERRVVEFVPEANDTAYEDATLRHLLDMRAGIVWDENYLVTSGPIIEYRKATGWNPLAPGETPSDLHSFYRSLREAKPHGGPVHYVSPNTDLLGWVIERASARRYSDVMSDLVWKKIGAERGAYITVDRRGAPRCAGGMCAALRDLLRVGQWLIEERPQFLASLERGDPQAWKKGDLTPYFPGLPLRYRSHWYVLEGDAPLFFGWGIHGQFLFVDAKNEIVIAKYSSQAQAGDVARMGLTIRGASELRKQLA